MRYRQVTQMDVIALPNIFMQYYEEASKASNFVAQSGICLESILIKAMETTIIDYEVLFIAETHGKIVGLFWGCSFVEFWSNKVVAQDYMIYVSPEYRKRFVAKRLLNNFEKWAKGQGAHFTRVGTNSGINNNKDAGRLYRGSGYEDIGSYLYKQL